MPPLPDQLSIFETVDPMDGKLKEALGEIDVNSMTPIECMMKLNELVKMMEDYSKLIILRHF